MRRRRLRLLACLVVTMFIVSAPGSAAAFGTIDTGGQRREHERVTRAALSCAGDAGSDPYCFEPDPSTISRDTTVIRGRRGARQ